jgi:hypothetical protein
MSLHPLTWTGDVGLALDRFGILAGNCAGWVGGTPRNPRASRTRDLHPKADDHAA